MMSLSEWPNNIVNLTHDDSDDDDGTPSSSMAPPVQFNPFVPLPGSSRATSTSASIARPTNLHVPLPGSTPRHAPLKVPVLVRQTPNGLTPPTGSSRPSSATSAASIGHNGARRQNYVPVSMNTYDGASDFDGIDRAEKRRKVSTHGRQTQTSQAPSTLDGTRASTVGTVSHQGNAGSISRAGSGFVAPARSRPAPSRHLGKGSSPNILNKAPSVQELNAALKTSGTTMPLVEKFANNRPRPLQIGRMPNNDGFDLPTTNSTKQGKASTTPTDAVPHAYNDARRVQDTSTRNCIKSNNIHALQAISQAETLHPPATQAVQDEAQALLHQQVRPSLFSGATSTQQDDEKDSVMSDASVATDRAGATPLTREVTSDQSPLLKFKKAVSRHPIQSRTPTSSFTEEEEHLLIYLKEVKKLKWQLITSEFNKDYPGRLYHTLQSRYATKTNKRDRSRDPAVLKLPARWADESVIDWATVHAENPGPRERVEVTNLRRGVDMGGVAPRPGAIRRTIDQDHSSGTESGTRQHRRRRAPPVNYDVRRRNRRLGVDLDDADFDDVISPQFVDMNTPMRSESPSDAQASAPLRSHIVISKPLEVHFDADDASIGLLARKTMRDAKIQKLPYLASSQRLALQNAPDDWVWDQLSSREWQGSLVHVDYSPSELEEVHRAVKKVRKVPQNSRHSTQRRHFRTILKDVTESTFIHLTQAIQQRLLTRDNDSIKAFLDDARAGNMTDAPQILRLSTARLQNSTSSVQAESTTAILRNRETGLRSQRGWQTATKPVTYLVRNKVMDTLGPSCSWTGASSDIHTVAWCPDGESFAAGAVAVTDIDSMQYNRPNNLLFGNLQDSSIHELAEHSKDRQRTEAGANSSHAMFVSQDPKLYTTVTSVAFAPSGKVMYSAGYDESICVWHLDEGSSQPTLGAKLKHKAEVEMLVVNRQYTGLLASAAKKSSGNAIKLLNVNGDDPSEWGKHNFHSKKAVERSDLRILPQALQFEPRFGHLLLAGFGANVRADNGFDTTGDLCLWDIETQAQIPIYGSNKNIFDVTFNPNRRVMPLFAAACVAGGNVNRGTRSIIRLYDEKGPDRYTCPREIECRALDMNDVVWCPQDEHLIAAGCTDARIYVWDMRSSDNPLMILSHGQSLMPLQDGIHHERTDTGVRFLSWGDNTTRLYSGSSDGIVKVWDVTRSTEDTFIKDLITVESGIMAGAFTSDHSKLILGEVNGSVNVLNVGRDDCTIKDTEKLRYVSYAGADYDQDSIIANSIGIATSNSGVAEGKHLLQSQQLQLAHMGALPIRQVVQGPNYAGPFDQSVDAPFLRQQALEFQLSMAAQPGPQCSIAACKDNIVMVTSEEIGDSGRSADRISDELRRQWTAVDLSARIMPGKSKCTHCSRPARPSPSTNDPDAPVLCERCSFACFRCGAVNPIAPATTDLICDSCAGVWDIGALGYECVEQPASTKVKLDVPALRQFGRDMLEERNDHGATTFGDEMNALTDYYFSLAIDRPESPPL